MNSSTPNTALTLDTAITLDRLARPSGAFAMVAMDQRESLRQMFTAATGKRVGDEKLVAFKRTVAAQVGPLASGFLIDTDFGFSEVAAGNYLPESCGLIVAIDKLSQHPDGPVEDTTIDTSINLHEARAAGAVAAKLLIIWRQDESRERNIQLAADFVRICADAGILSVLEPVAKPTKIQESEGRYDAIAGIREAALELGALRPSLYKAQIPLAGKAAESTLTNECAELTKRIPGPWVVLSQGVERADFPAAVRAACRAGASGMLAGRAIWSDLVGAAESEEHLAQLMRERAVPRLEELAEIVDTHARPWNEAS